MRALKIAAAVVALSIVGLFAWAQIGNWLEKSGQASVAAKPDKSLGLTVREFTSQYNATINAAEYRLSAPPPVSNGEKFDSFKVQVTPLAAVGGTVNKEDGSLREVMVISGSDGSAKRKDEQAIAMIAAAKAVQPHRDTSEIFRQLTAMVNAVSKKSEAEKSVSGNVLYTMSAPAGLGLWLVLSAQ